MKSIRRQLLRKLLLVLAALSGTGMVVICFAAWFTLVDSFDESLQARAQAVTSLTEMESGRVEFDFSDDFLRGFGVEHARNYFELWDSGGAVLAHSPSLGEFDLPRRATDLKHRSRYWNLTLPNGRPARAVTYLFSPTSDHRQTAPLVQVAVAIDRERLNERLGGLWAVAGVCGLLLAGAVFLVVPGVLRRGLAPLEQLGEQAAAIDASSLAARFPRTGLPAELQPICERLNELLARLESSFERERQLSADLAHELRTPIAELRHLAEFALKWPEARDAAADQDLFAIARQMEILVKGMLTLARGESGQMAAHPAPLAIAPFVTDAWRPFAERAGARGLQATFALDAATVEADPVLLRSILSNLFDNAVDYAPEGGEVRISGNYLELHYSLRIANQAGTLVPGDVDRFFDRFWRKEAARTGGEHVGLGLNLARTFAAAMGWRLAASLDPDQWLAITLGPAARLSARP